MSVTHLAGGFIRIGPRAIQRCMVCGYKLVDDDLRNVAVPEGQEDRGIGHWKTGDLVHIDEQWSISLGELKEDFGVDELPADFCLELVEP